MSNPAGRQSSLALPQQDPSNTNEGRTVEEEVLRGTVARVTYRNSENGYSVLQVDTSRYGRMTVVGTALDLSSGSHIVARGNLKEHKKYGTQFSASSITATTPSGTNEIEKYLGSGMVKGIGPKTARRIVKELGEDTFAVIEHEPARLAQISGIGQRKANQIKAAFQEQFANQESIRFLIEHNVSPGLATKICHKYGNQTVELVSRNPYRLAKDIRGIGFKTADSIAHHLGIVRDDPERLKAGLLYVLERATDDGHCFLPAEQLSQRARELLDLDPQGDLQNALNEHVASGDIIDDEGKFYLPYLFRAENSIADFVSTRCQLLTASPIPEQIVNRALEEAEMELGIRFSHEQRRAVQYAGKARMLIITGGPGCGKTTVTRALSILFQRANKKLLLAAPTGRAAQRLGQVTGLPASTIHRLLKYDPHRNTFTHEINDPLIADAIIVDEASMIDVSLGMALFAAIAKDTTLILVGDKDQLPSVGPGKLLGDLLAIKELTSIALGQLFRRDEQSIINSIAHMINCGETPSIPEPDGVTKTDAYFLSRSSSEQLLSTVEQVVAHQIPTKFGYKLNDTMILTPSNRGPLGTINMNTVLQERLNPAGRLDSEQRLNLHGVEYRVGDRVCQRTNNYELGGSGVFNGDLGYVYEIDRSKETLTVELWDGRLITYDKQDAMQLALAYAMTVHRAQGSEAPCVVLVLHDSHFTLLQRQLIYTAVTRAKQLLIVIGSKRALGLACKRTLSTQRCTALQERIQYGIRTGATLWA